MLRMVAYSGNPIFNGERQPFGISGARYERPPTWGLLAFQFQKFGVNIMNSSDHLQEDS
jgi:hypothetical protein